jgi:uncharacterized protein (TIGR01319 family)
MMSNGQEQETHALDSFLIADCGNTNTTVALFDVAAGSYRLIARATVPSTVTAPWSDITEGIQQAVSQITEVTGRPLLNDRGTLIKPTRRDGSGVDHFTAVVSAAPPLETLVVGLFDEVSLASARRALQSIYAKEIDSFSLSDDRSEQEQVAALIEKKPDLIFLVGGTDGGAEQRLMKLVELVRLGVRVLAEVKRPQLLFAGNINLRERIRETIGEGANVQVANNVRPNLQVEQIDDAVRTLVELYEDIKIQALPGIQEIRSWSSFRPVPTARAFAAITKYFAALYEGRVLGVDLGSDSVTLVAADSEQVDVIVRPDLGMGRPIVNLLDKIGPTAIARWMPSEISHQEITDFIHNKAVHPQTTPMTEVEQRLEQAIIRQILQCVMAESPGDWGWSVTATASPYSLLLVRGASLVSTTRPRQAILMLLDALQPRGVFSVALDKYGVLPALGALAAHNPLAAVQALEAGVLVDLGWVIVPTGRGQAGQNVLHVLMESDQIGQLELDVEYGTIEVILLAPDQSAEVTLQPTRRFDIGFGAGKQKKVVLHGGAVGLVVDARGRPLEFPHDEMAQRSLVRQWLWDIGG